MVGLNRPAVRGGLQELSGDHERISLCGAKGDSAGAVGNHLGTCRRGAKGDSGRTATVVLLFVSLFTDGDFMIMQAEAEANSPQRSGSTGPRTPEGKARSRENAMKHGLTARIVLPWEDEAEYDARLARFKTGLPIQSELEEELAERAAQASWLMDRALLAERERVIQQVANDPAAAALREEKDAEALGHRLMFDRRGPAELYPSGEYERNQPRTSCSGDPNDPDSPRITVLIIEGTGAGCRWLLNVWGEMREILADGLGWQSEQKFKAVRLLGRQPLAVSSTRLIARIFLACHVIEPQFSYAFQELRCEIPEERFKRFKARMEKRNLEKFTPKDPTEARAVLLEIVDQAIARLKMLEAHHREKAKAAAPGQVQAQSYDGSKTGEQIKRYHASCDRLVHRNMEAIKRARRYEAQGWDCVREARERRKAERRAAIEADGRVVVDEHGTVRNAYDYKGDLAAGLARSEALFGPEGAAAIAASRPIGADPPPDVRAVPDFARWKPTTVDGGLPLGVGSQPDVRGVEVRVETPRGEDRDAEQAIDAAPGLESGIPSAEPDGADPVIVAGKGEGARFQNELAQQKDGERRTEDGSEAMRDDVEYAAERQVGRFDAEHRDEEGGKSAVPLMVTETGEGARFQNELPQGEDGERRSEDGLPGMQDGGRRTEDGGGGAGDIVQCAPERHEGHCDAESRNEEGGNSTVPLLLTETREGARFQNELPREHRNEDAQCPHARPPEQQCSALGKPREVEGSGEACGEQMAGLPERGEGRPPVHPPPGVPIM
jgi:hypothetical protein